MMQNSLFIQIISGAVTIILYSLSLLFWNKEDEFAEVKKQRKMRVITILMAITTIIGACYFFYNLIIACNTGKDIFFSILKGSICIIIIIEIFLYRASAITDIEAQMMFVFCGVIAIMGIIFIGDFVYDEIIETKYEKNIVQAEEPKIIEEKYKLYPIYKENESASSYFRIITNEEEEKVYEFYYIIDEETQEMLNDTLHVEYNGVVPLKEGEKEPYLYIKSEVKYSINNNENPPIEIDQMVISTKYELHISEKDIKKVVQSTK